MGEDVIITYNNLKEMRVNVNERNELTITSSGEEKYILCDNMSKDFDVIAENNGVISVMAIAINGTLIYFRYVSGRWEKQIVLDSKSESKKIHNIKLAKINGRIHAFYCVEYDDKMLLIHHISQNDSFYTKPAVIDYISTKCIYHISIDCSFNIHIVYADENLRMKYKTFIYSAKKYSDNTVNCEDRMQTINTMFFQNELYCVYLSKARNYNVINCLKLSNWERKTISFGVGTLGEPCIFGNDHVLYIHWLEKGYAFECSSENKMNFSKPFSLGRSDKLLKLRTFTNESVSFIDKCAENIYNKPFPSAKACFEFLCEKEKAVFKVKGSEIEEFQKKSMEKDNHLYEDQRFDEIEEKIMYLINLVESINKRVSNINKEFLANDTGELDKENFDKFYNTEKPDVPKEDELEYIENKEELT